MRLIVVVFALLACAPLPVTSSADAAPDGADAPAVPVDTSAAGDATADAADAPVSPVDAAVDARPSCPDHAERVGAACRCVTGYTVCDGRCVDLFNDGANCGACATLCEGGICALGRCVAVTPPVDAGRDAGDAAADAGDQCGGSCASLANVATAECTAINRCSIVRCAAGFADCDRLDLNGCETMLGTRSNCGACRDVCAGSSFCGGGVCR